MLSYLCSIRKSVALAFANLFVVVTLTAQSVTPVQKVSGIPKIGIAEMIGRASAQALEYVAEFRNLIAREKKSIRSLDKKGTVKSERTIVSNFIVYELANAKRSMTEFRSVLSVDGRTIPDSDKRAIDLFENITKQPPSASDLEKLQKESLRYDDELRIYGLTLYQAIILSEKVRDIFAFELTGTSKIGNDNVYIINYRQTKQSPFVRLGQIKYDVPAILDYGIDLGGLDNVNERLSGTLWIDVNTFQVVREVRTLTISPAEFRSPVTMASNEFDYSSSPFGIRTPRRIIHTEYRIERSSSSSSKRIELIYEYSDFTRPDVVVKTAANER